MASAGQLESMGLVAEPEKPAPPIFRLSRTDRIRSNRWPSYQLLECSDAARADYIVTGNQRHFPGFWKQTKVITSREFMDIIAPHLLP
jgi:hypothetical protein